MRLHHHAVGERVFYAGHRFPYLVCNEPCTIIRCLESMRSEPQYQIHSVHRPYEHMAGEDELSRGAMPMRSFREPEFPNFLDGGGMNEAANLNLVPLDRLPRRARHKNEPDYLLRAGGHVR